MPWSSRAAAALAAAVTFTAPMLGAPAAVAATTVVSADVRAHVLVLDDGSPNVGAILARLTYEGMPHTRVDLSGPRDQITPAWLAPIDAQGARARFSGVVVPNEAPAQLQPDELAALSDYEATFKVREVVAYTWANPAVGLNYAANPGYMGSLDGTASTITPAGLAGPFAYLRGTVAFDDIAPAVLESYGYLATPLPDTTTSSFTPLVTAPIPNSDAAGSLLGVQATDGRERLVVTASMNQYQGHAMALTPGIVDWLTRGIGNRYARNWFSMHIDDVLLPDNLWSVEGNCTIGDGCDPVLHPEDSPDATARMVPADVSHLTAWQNRTGLKLDMVWNGFGATEAKASGGGTDPLEAALLAGKRQLRWINHTWSHPNLGCVQDFSATPWSCVTDASGAIQYQPYSVIRDEIAQNQAYATANALPNQRRDSLVTGQHSGLKTLPQMAVDNPNLARALTDRGIKWIGADASRERDPRRVGSATTVPRHPTNIYYNTATKAQAVDEYSWIYTSAADGGSGLCDTYTETMTCISPLDPATGFDEYIVPIETRIALSHVMANDPRPHYAHQSN